MKKNQSILRNFQAFLFLIFLTGNVSAQCIDPFIVDLGKDTVICEGGALYLDAGPGVSYLWNDGSVSRTLLVTLPGIYFVLVQEECGKTDSDTIIIEMVPNPVINLNYPDDKYFCKGEQVLVNAEVVNPVSTILYEWSSSNINDPVVSIDTTGTYNLTATDIFGCKTIKTFSLEFQYPYEEEKIMLVSYDASEDRNIVVWSRTPEKRTMDYELYNGVKIEDRMAVTDFNSLNLMVDYETDPHAGSGIYNLMVKDSCGNYSEFDLNKAHKSMYLDIREDQDGYNMLVWECYTGFLHNYYYICRGTNPDEMEVIDSVAYDRSEIYSYSDKTTLDDVLYFYQVRVKTPEIIYLDDATGKKAGHGPFVHSLSNLEDKLRTGSGIQNPGYLQHHFKIYPNPVDSKALIHFRVDEESQVCIAVYNILGEKVAELYNQVCLPGTQIVTYQPEKHMIEKGLYFVRLTIDNSIHVSKILIQN